MDIIRNFLAALTALTLSCFCFPASGQNTQAGITLSSVVIDPGHGGKDAGCVSPSGKTMEKTIVLDIGKRLSGKIRSGYPEVKVIMTRSTDTFVTLQGRADIANRNNANLFISIHINSVEGKKNGPNGFSVHTLGQYTSKNKDLYAGNLDVVRRENSVIKLEDDYNAKYDGFDPNDPESYIFMNLMQNAFLEQSLKFAQYVDGEMKGGPIRFSRGISQDPFYVLWRTAMPAVLVECGFMSNSEDRESLITENGRELIASELYEAFKKFKMSYDGGTAVKNPSDNGSETQSPSVVKDTTADLTSGVDDAPDRPGEPSSSHDGEKTAEDNGTLYGVQVLVSSRVKASDDPFFKGHPFKEYKTGKVYKYVIGFSEDVDQAKKNHTALKKQFPDSFIVKVENGYISKLN